MFNLDDYETVEERLVKFWKDHPDGRIETELVEYTNSRFIVKARIFRDKGDTSYWASGYAFENVSDRGVNSTSALENCETSAIGRALANAGFATKGKRASREEMTKVKAKVEVAEAIQATKAKMAETAKEYVPVAKADDPWTTWESPAPQTMETAVEMVKQVLGGTAADESCVHGARIWKTGTSKAGKPWGHWRCSAQVTRDMPGGEQPCDPIWYEIAKDGSWQKRAA